MSHRIVTALSIVVVLAAHERVPAQTCEYECRALPQDLVPTVYPPYFYVRALALHDDGAGAAIFAGGTFGGAEGGLVSRGVAKWDGERWVSLDGGVDQGVAALVVHDDGGGPALYVGGNFAVAGGVAANGVARWDGENWSPLGLGVTSSGPCTWCNYATALASFTGIDGIPRLYAGGNFTHAGTLDVNYIAQWNGSTWSALGTGVDNSPVVGFEVFNDGSGPALYVIGNFDSAGGVPGTRRIARWDGQNWSSVGGGWTSEFDVIYDLQVFDDGTGPALYASGFFDYPGNVRHLAKWDGATWTRLGSTPVQHDTVITLEVFDDGTGPALYAGGTFQVGALHWQTSVTVAKWTGSDFVPLTPSLGLYVLDLLAYADASGSVLMAGGQFTLLDGAPAISIARWTCVDVMYGDLNCDGVVNLEDLPHFVVALLSPRDFEGCNSHRADVTDDGREDGLDIQTFVQMLLSP